MNTNEILIHMTNITNRYVKYYRTDFTEHDASAVREISEKGEKARYLWFVRESGTYFINLDGENAEKNLAILREHYPEYREYTVIFSGEKWTIKKTGGKTKTAAKIAV